LDFGFRGFELEERFRALSGDLRFDDGVVSCPKYASENNTSKPTKGPPKTAPSVGATAAMTSFTLCPKSGFAGHPLDLPPAIERASG
jgi:hypothetical protein